MMVAIGQRASQSAQRDHVSVTGSCAEYQRVPAADSEADSFADRQAVQPRFAQCQVSAFLGDRAALKERCNGLDKIGQSFGPLARTRPFLAYVGPFAGCVTCAKAQPDPARREHVESSRVCRYVHRLADACLHHIGAQAQGLRYRRGASQRWPWRGSGAWMIAHQQSAKSG